MHTSAHADQKRPLGPTGLGLQAAVRPPQWVLRTEPWSSVRAVCSPNYCAIFPAPRSKFLNNQIEPGTVAHALNPSKQDAGGSLLVEASLVYAKEFQDNQVFIEKPYLKNKITTNENKTKRLLSLPSVIQCSQLISTRMAFYLDISGKTCMLQVTVLAYSQRLSGQSHILASRSVWGWWSVLEDYGVNWLMM